MSKIVDKDNHLNERQPRYSWETEEAMSEAKDIAAGKIEAKAYDSVEALFRELDKV